MVSAWSTMGAGTKSLVIFSKLSVVLVTETASVETVISKVHGPNLS